MINNTMLVQIAVLAWIFLDKQISMVGLIGLGLAAFGVLLANWQGDYRTRSGSRHSVTADR